MDRRTFVLTTGVTLASVGIAGCGEEGTGPDESPEEDGAVGADGGEGDGGDGETTAGEVDEDLADLGEWTDVEDITLEAYTEGWEGVEPGPVEGETNPTLVLIEGNEYTVTWTNADGEPHDFTLWDENEEEIDATDIVEEEGAEASLSFQATQEINQYVCTVHQSTMLGDVRIQSEDGSGDDDGG